MDDVATIHTLLSKANKLNMTETRYSYLFTNLVGIVNRTVLR